MRMRKILMTALACVLPFCCIIPTSALEEVEYTSEYFVSENEMNENLEMDRENIISELSNKKGTCIPEYVEYDYKIIGTEYPTASGWAGNCPVGGVKFLTGGAFYWEESGGDNISVSLGASYGGASVGISLGKRSTDKTGYICKVPSTTAFYRLWSKPKYKVVPQKVYGRAPGSTIFEYLYTIYPKTLYSVELAAKKVG